MVKQGAFGGWVHFPAEVSDSPSNSQHTLGFTMSVKACTPLGRSGRLQCYIG
jgi:hypothetical protein